MSKIIETLCVFGIMMFSVPINASLLISDLDLNNLSFEVDNLTPPTTTGTSNGIGFTVSGNYFTPFSNTTGAQSYNDLPDSYDDLHLGSNFTISFDQEIDFLLVALANDNNSGDGLNFGLTPSDSKDVSISGTQISITDITGALLLYEFTSPIISISHTNNAILDGFDVSFFAGTVSTVPVPAAVWLFGSGLIGLIGIRTKASKISTLSV